MKNRLKAIRKELRLKQRDLAERLDVALGVVGKWESGASPIPPARIYQICKEYNIRRDWFENGKGEMFETSSETREERLEDGFVALYNRLDRTAQKAALKVFKRLLEEETKNEREI